jgi:hypothetical protein
MQKWEYLTVDTQNAYQRSFTVVADHGNDVAEGLEMSEYLTTLGKHGWELVCSHRLETAMFGIGERFFFKRPAPDSEP